MGKKELQSQRDKLRVLYGRDPNEDRYIDVKSHKKTITRCQMLLVAITIIAVFSFAFCYIQDKRGFVFGIGEQSNGEKFYGVVNIETVKSQYTENPDDLDFAYLNVIDIVIAGGIAIVVLYLMIAISLLDRINISKKNIRAYYDYLRRVALKEEEERDYQQDLLANKVEHAPELKKED